MNTDVTIAFLEQKLNELEDMQQRIIRVQNELLVKIRVLRQELARLKQPTEERSDG